VDMRGGRLWAGNWPWLCNSSSEGGCLSSGEGHGRLFIIRTREKKNSGREHEGVSNHEIWSAEGFKDRIIEQRSTYVRH